MRAAEIVGRGVAFDLESENPEVLEALTRTVLYHYTEDLDTDLPLEWVESQFIELYEGYVPTEIDRFLDSLDDPWSPEDEIVMDI